MKSLVFISAAGLLLFTVETQATPIITLVEKMPIEESLNAFASPQSSFSSTLSEQPSGIAKAVVHPKIRQKILRMYRRKKHFQKGEQGAPLETEKERKEKDQDTKLTKEHMIIMYKAREVFAGFEELRDTALDKWAEIKKAEEEYDYPSKPPSFVKAYIFRAGQLRKEAMKPLSIYPARFRELETKLEQHEKELDAAMDTETVKCLKSNTVHYILGARKAQLWLAPHFKHRNNRVTL